MKNIIKKYSIFMSLIVLTIIGCDGGFEELNQNPNDPLQVSPNLLLGQIAKSTVDLTYSTFNGGDMGACWSQQLSKVQYNDEERFNPRQGSISSVWNGIYTNVISDANSMYQLADAEGNNNLKGVALVLQSYGYLLLTDLYGDIPFTEAMQAEVGNIAPKYNTQEDVYNGVLAMLDNAAALIGTGGTINASSDLVYAGNVNNWKKFANSLKFRALMRISKKVNVSVQLQELIDGGNLFTSNDDEAKFAYQVENPNANPFYESIVFGTRNEWKVCNVFVDQLINTNDPRLPQMVDDLDDDGVYRGKPSGIADVPSDDYSYANVSAIGPYYLRGDLPGYYMSYSELEFLIAEAITRSDISVSAGSAADHYNAGILSSFISAGANLGLAASFQANGAIMLNGNEMGDLEKIATQNWIGLYLQGFESLIEQRRTGFPVLPMPLDAYISDFPIRLNYPNIESSINSVNYNEAIQRQGPDLLTTKMWRLQ
jgi:hypothetical protein